MEKELKAIIDLEVGNQFRILLQYIDVSFHMYTHFKDEWRLIVKKKGKLNLFSKKIKKTTFSF